MNRTHELHTPGSRPGGRMSGQHFHHPPPPLGLNETAVINGKRWFTQEEAAAVSIIQRAYREYKQREMQHKAALMIQQAYLKKKGKALPRRLTAVSADGTGTLQKIREENAAIAAANAGYTAMHAAKLRSEQRVTGSTVSNSWMRMSASVSFIVVRCSFFLFFASFGV
jgi:hypothetical protein